MKNTLTTLCLVLTLAIPGGGCSWLDSTFGDGTSKKAANAIADIALDLGKAAALHFAKKGLNEWRDNDPGAADLIDAFEVTVEHTLMFAPTPQDAADEIEAEINKLPEDVQKKACTYLATSLERGALEKPLGSDGSSQENWGGPLYKALRKGA